MGPGHITQHLHFSRWLLFVFIFKFGFHIINAQSSAASICDQYKFSVQHPNQPSFCIPCKICPSQAEGKFYNDACRNKIPNQILGQGHAWCTGNNDKSPWCQLLSVSHGELDCTSNNDVYSTCKLECDSGYKPSHSSPINLECLDSLHWNTSESLLGCNRAVRPDKPSVVSQGQRQEVKSGSDKTLKCNQSSQTVGRRKIYWYFKDKQLNSDPDSDIYVVHSASVDSEGEYFCEIQDEIGKSDLSVGYFLKVENINTGFLQNGLAPGIIALGIFATVVFLMVLLWVCYKRDTSNKCCTTLWHIITKCHYPKKDDKRDSCLSIIVSSTGGYIGTSITSSSTDNGTIFEEEKKPLTESSHEKIIPETECPLLTKQEQLNDCNEKVNEYSLASALKHQGRNDDDKEISEEKDKIMNIRYKDAPEISDADSQDLRSVLNNFQQMKRLRTLLDQKAAIVEEKPTFHSLGRFLEDNTDQIAHLEFMCQQEASSPTERYIRKMTEQGLGLSTLLTFLKNYKHTKKLAEEIEHEVSQNYNASVV